ncbi:MAG: hypothetical protein Q9219_000878 [cf. Caloplaca sp. 3 TL-2023]
MPCPRPATARKALISKSFVSRKCSARCSQTFAHDNVHQVRFYHFNAPRKLFNVPLRAASTAAAAAASTASAHDARSFVTRVKNVFLGTTIGLALILGYYYATDTRSSIHEFLVIPCLRYIYPDAEDAHEFGNRALKVLGSFGIHPRERGNPDEKSGLSVEIFGHTLSNPMGVSAGLDKHGHIPDQLFAAGPSIVEIGGVTPLPQEGNPKPRVWRIPSQNALINRYGLNSEGADHVAMRLRQRVREYAYRMGWGIDEEAEQRILDGDAGVPPGSLKQGKLMAVQVAKNKWTPDADIQAVKNDYVYCVEALSRFADILVVNVSSPNTPGLRGLQKVEPLTEILTAVVGAARKAKRKTPPKVMVKVSPDEDSEEDVRGICNAVMDSGIDGVVVGNTTRKRPDPVPKGYLLPPQEQRLLLEQGGFSGSQTFDHTLGLVTRYRKLLDEGSFPQTEDTISVPSTDTSTAPTKSILSSISSPLATPEATHPPTTDREIDESVARDAQRLKPETSEAEAASKSQPIIRFPERNNLVSTSSTSTEASSESTSSDKTHSSVASSSTDTTGGPSSTASPSAPSERTRKVIFATGGITCGSQALEVLDAGADVAQIYTALVYSGIGTISKIKEEMRAKLKQHGKP